MLNFSLGQVADFAGSLANGASATPQDTGNITPTAMSEFQRFQTCIATTVLFRQAVVISPHCLFYLVIIGLHKGLLKSDVYYLKRMFYVNPFVN
jgi:hypothetical protein